MFPLEVQTVQDFKQFPNWEKLIKVGDKYQKYQNIRNRQISNIKTQKLDGDRIQDYENCFQLLKCQIILKEAEVKW